LYQLGEEACQHFLPWTILILSLFSSAHATYLRHRFTAFLLM